MRNITELSTKELEELLANRKKHEQAERENKKKHYEKQRDQTINELLFQAGELASILAGFKQKVHNVMDEQAIGLGEYGKIRTTSKGGFSISTLDGMKRVIRRRDTDPVWDERANKAVQLIKDFLSDTVKKRDAKLHEILMGFLERNDKGDLEYAKVMDLLQYENSFEDHRWKEGLQLIKESYSLSFKAYGYEFKTKNETGKWETLTLNFSSL